MKRGEEAQLTTIPENTLDVTALMNDIRQARGIDIECDSDNEDAGD